MNIESYITNKHRIRAKLIFNPKAGANDESPVQLMDVIKEMQALKFIPETCIMDQDCDIQGIIQDAITQGIRMFVACGGDGTVSCVAKCLIGTNATLGIIPTGTQNNIALSLNIPANIPDAITLLRTGKRIFIDVGIVTCGDITSPFIEICSVGLFSTLFPAGDGIQHGDIMRIGDFLTALTSSPPSQIRLLLDDKEKIERSGYVAIISNMPYFGRHYKAGHLDSFNDGLLDVLVFADLSKLDLIGCALKRQAVVTLEDPRIQRFKVKKVLIDTDPPMHIMADSMKIGEGSVQIEVRRHAMAVMAGPAQGNELKSPGEALGK